jgi:hypothetical protein
MMKFFPLLITALLLINISGALAQETDCLRLGALRCEMQKLNIHDKVFDIPLTIPFYAFNTDFWKQGDRLKHAREDCGHTYFCGMIRGLYEAGYDIPLDMSKDELIAWLEKNGLRTLAFPLKAVQVKGQVDAWTNLHHKRLHPDEYIDGFDVGRNVVGAIGL